MAIFTVINSGGLLGQNLGDTGTGTPSDKAGFKDIDGDGTADLRLVAFNV